MKKETESRKALKKELVRSYQKAFEKDFEAMDIPKEILKYAARETVEQIVKETGNGNDKTLRRNFNRHMKAARKEMDHIRSVAAIGAISRPAEQGRVDLTPRPQPPTVEIPSNKGPVWY